jgi:hypothetical protein
MKKLLFSAVLSAVLFSCTDDIVPKEPIVIEKGLGYELVTAEHVYDSVWIDVRDYTTHDGIKTEITIVGVDGNVKFKDSVENKLPNDGAHLFSEIEKGDKMVFGWSDKAFLDKALRQDLQYISVMVKYQGVVFSVHFNKDTEQPFIKFN